MSADYLILSRDFPSFENMLGFQRWLTFFRDEFLAEIVVEMATHHACDDWDRMIKGDEGMESIYYWNETLIGESKRGASGGGDGVHILTGPIYVEDAEPGDLLKVEILDLVPRPNSEGKTFGYDWLLSHCCPLIRPSN